MAGEHLAHVSDFLSGSTFCNCQALSSISFFTHTQVLHREIEADDPPSDFIVG